MWIRTQDRKRLVDIVDIMIIKVDDHFELCGYPINDCDCKVELGEYKSERGAIRALNGIHQQIGIDDVYKMPRAGQVEDLV